MKHVIQKTMSLILTLLFFVSTLLFLPNSANALTQKELKKPEIFKQNLEKAFAQKDGKPLTQSSVKAYYQGNAIDWQKSFGGTDFDTVASMAKTTDGGYILAGYTYSINDGDVTGYHYGVDSEGFLTSDAWIVKTDASGTVSWKKCIGGTGNDDISSVIATSDGYAVLGYSASTDGDLTGIAAGDVWVAKLGTDGAITWQYRYDLTSNYYYMRDIVQLTDGSFAIGVMPEDFNNITVVKITPSGALSWSKTYGGNGVDFLSSIKPTADGGIILAAIVSGGGGNVSYYQGGTDAWFVKINADNSVGWNKCIGTSGGNEDAYCVLPVADGYIVSYDYYYSGYDFYQMQLGKIGLTGGNIQWGTSVTTGYMSGLIGTLDGGYAYIGGNSDYRWVSELNSSCTEVARVGFSAGTRIFDLIQTVDKGFVFTGDPDGKDFQNSSSHGYGDMWMVKLKPMVPATGIALDKTNVQMYPTDSISINPAMVPANATTKVMDLISNNPGVANVDTVYDEDGDPVSFTIKSVSPGNAIIYAVSIDYITQCNVTVNPYTPVSISCQKTDVTLYGGSNGTITVTASGGNSGTFEYSADGGVTWQASNVIGNLKAGTYSMVVRDKTYTANLSAVASVAIGQPAFAGTVNFKKIPAKAKAGTAITINRPTPPKGFTLLSVPYASSNRSVADVDASGTITFLKGGKAKITITMVCQNNKNGKIKTTKIVKQITVNELVSSITLNQSNSVIAVKQKLKITATVLPSSATKKTLKWTSSNKKVATVSNKGLVVAKSKGTAIITCTAQDGSRISASCVVTVN